MVTLLSIEKRRLIAEGRDPSSMSVSDFNEVWERCWKILVDERGWAHATRLRRSMRQSQDETKEECCAAFLDRPTPFAFAAGRLSEAASGMCLELCSEQLGKALLAAFTYVELDPADEARAIRSADAAHDFVTNGSEIAA